MNFYFDSWQAFVQMGNHGPFVWACYAMVLAILLWLTLAPGLKKRQLRALSSRHERIKARSPNP